MTIDIGGVFAKPKFEVKKKSVPRAEDATCLEVLKDSDSIIFTGKLTANFTEYKATLNDNSIFTFTFGANVMPPVPTEKPQTSSTIQTTSATVTEQPETQPEPPTENPNESGTSSPASNGNDNSVSEQESTPTTSSGNVGLASTSTALLVIITQFLAQ